MKTIETLILTNLLQNEEYMRKVIPFLRDDYFSTYIDKKIFQEINTFIDTYNKAPSKEALTIVFQNKNDLKEEEYTRVVDAIETFNTKEANQDWLIAETEKFCRDKAVFNAVRRSIKILEGQEEKLSADAIPSLLQDALGVTFDNSIGHDYMEDAEERYDFYHEKEERIPFDLEMFNKITNGGLPKKTLSVCLAGVNVGKSLFMCHHAAASLAAGYNVLYITMEMAEERIAERIDANLLNIPLNDLGKVEKSLFINRIEKIQKKTQGKLIIKEYPTGAAHSGHFRALLNDCRIKKNFVPDIIFIDYLNICSSSRFKMSNNVNSYTFVKAIAEELRGLAVEFDVPIMTATQVTRGGFSSTDVEMTDTSESFGLPATADFMFALMSTDELEKLGQWLVKQLKNRLSNKSVNKRFMVGVDKSRMRVFDVEQSAQEGLVDDTPKSYKLTHGVTSTLSKRDFGQIKT